MHHQINQLMAQAIQSFQTGNLDDAERSFVQVLKFQSKNFDALHILGVVKGLKNQHQEALDFFRKALRIDPNNSFLNFNIAKAFSEVGEEEKALKYHLIATRLNPDYPEGWLNFGISILKLQKFKESLDYFNRALRIKPDYAEAWLNLGNALTELNRYDEALASSDKAISIKPDFAEAWSSRGNVLSMLNQYEEALASFSNAISIKPDYAEAWSNRGIALTRLNQYDEALASSDKAISIKPDCVEAWSNRGNALSELNHYEEALASFSKAISIKPDYAEAWSNRGKVLGSICDFELAEACYREAIRVDHKNLIAHNNLLFNFNYLDSINPQEVLKEARNYGSKVSQISSPKFTSWNISPVKEKLRIGFVSGDLRNHPVGYFIEGLVKHLDKAQFEIYAFPTVSKTDDLTARLKPFFTEWTPIYGKGDIEAASVIHQKGIHILIDLAGHTVHNRLAVFSYKPAPVQVCWLGYFATTGLPEMDYFIGDPHLSPSGESDFFTEDLWNLPETWFSQTPAAFELPISDLPALSNGFVTFGSFSNLSKINYRVIETWASVLKLVPRSKLLMMSNQLGDANQINEVQKRFENFNISSDRLLFEHPLPREYYFKMYNRVDIILDTFPYPGGTTSVDALWMGVPILTIKGNRFLSRLGESIAINAGNSEWIAEDVQEYVTKAVKLSSDYKRLAQQRSTLRDKILKSPLFGVDRFAKFFEEALLGMWHKKSELITRANK